MAETFSPDQVEDAFASARSKVATILGREQSYPSSDKNFYSVYFQLRPPETQVGFLAQGNFAQNMHAVGQKVLTQASMEPDVHGMIILNDTFLKNPNQALRDILHATQKSGLVSQDFDESKLLLSKKDVAAIQSDWGRENINANYEAHILQDRLAQSGQHYSRALLASASDIMKGSFYSHLSEQGAIAVAQVKQPLEKSLGVNVNTSVAFNGTVLYQVSTTDPKQETDVRNNLQKLRRDGLVEYSRTLENDPLTGHSVTFDIKPTRKFELQTLKDSPAAKDALGVLHDKAALSNLEADFRVATDAGATPQFLNNVRGDLGIKADSSLPAHGRVSPRQAYGLLKLIDADSSNGLDDKAKAKIDGEIRSLSKHLKKEAGSSDELTDKEKTEARNTTQQVITRGEETINKRSAAPKPPTISHF